jgi:hypothetical protein
MRSISFFVLILALPAAVSAQRPTCPTSSPAVEVLRLCEAFGFDGRCAVYTSLTNFEAAHPEGVIMLGTWYETRAIRWQTACLIPEGFYVTENTGHMAFFVDEAGYPVHGNEGRDNAFCGTSAGDRIAVRSEFNAACGAGTLSPWIYGGQRLEVYGRGGDDEIFGGAGDERIDGGTGDDSVAGGEGADEVYGGIGEDSINEACQEGDAFFGGDDDDFIRMVLPVSLTDESEEVLCVIDAGDGDDVVRGAYLPYGSSVVCGAGNDTMIWKFNPSSLYTPWSNCPADCEIFQGDPGLIEYGAAAMCL